MKLWAEATNEFERQWNRNFLKVFLPGFAIFGVGGVTRLDSVVLLGWAIAAIGMLRGFRLIRYFRRCTGCRIVNYTRVGDDGSCFYCGVDLPLNGPD